ncbi:DUF4232 domain-containing protein [Arthrobacter sp. NPDC090010]|uniref:DUF4232 domain-containing protein n=1 Tax=Arthrobacter sp. NPDC090010 TaxID=3363942 RepID=UPI003820E3C3
MSASLDTSGGGAAGSVYGKLLLKNTGTAACTIQGFARVELTAGDSGPAIGAAAEKEGGAGVPATLRPGQSAAAVLRYSQAGLHPDCQHVPATRYRVYAPGTNTPMFIPVTEDGCSNAAVKLLTIQAFAPAA